MNLTDLLLWLKEIANQQQENKKQLKKEKYRI